MENGMSDTTINSFVGKTLVWKQESMFKSAYQLLADEMQIGFLSFPKFFSLDGKASGFGGTWIFRQPRLFYQDVNIYREGNELPFAKFVTSFWKLGGTVELPKGKRVKVDYNMWKGLYTISDSTGQTLAQLRVRLGWKAVAETDITSQGAKEPELLCILFLVFYVATLRRRHASHGS